VVDGKEYDQLFINPALCSDCALCEANCEPAAIFAVDDLPASVKHFAAINAAFFKS
jgi:NAD-dependent dihydropyrimidine dehydrogenase PreA subunit